MKEGPAARSSLKSGARSRLVSYMRKAIGLVGSVAMGVFFGVTASHAETTNCTAINAVPFTISSPGSYCLTIDLGHAAFASGNAITIAANAVVLDLNEHKLGGSAAGVGTQAIGIYGLNRRQITIKNGTVRGYLRGIWLDDTTGSFTASRGNLIEDVHAESNTETGIRISGHGSIVRGNKVADTGGTTSSGPNVPTFGIQVFGPENRILDNDVTDTLPVGSEISVGISAAGEGTIVEGNRVGNGALVASKGLALTGGDVLAVGNRMSRFTTGLEMSGSGGKYRDNLTAGCTTAYSGVTDVGNNQ